MSERKHTTHRTHILYLSGLAGDRENARSTHTERTYILTLSSPTERKKCVSTSWPAGTHTGNGGTYFPSFVVVYNIFVTCYYLVLFTYVYIANTVYAVQGEICVLEPHVCCFLDLCV